MNYFYTKSKVNEAIASGYCNLIISNENEYTIYNHLGDCIKYILCDDHVIYISNDKEIIISFEQFIDNVIQ